MPGVFLGLFHVYTLFSGYQTLSAMHPEDKKILVGGPEVSKQRDRKFGIIL
jgi:hypothetical protein